MKSRVKAVDQKKKTEECRREISRGFTRSYLQVGIHANAHLPFTIHSKKSQRLSAHTMCEIEYRA